MAFCDSALDAKVVLSFGSVGDAFDNAAIEAFWSTLRRELAHIHHRRRWTSRAELRAAVPLSAVAPPGASVLARASVRAHADGARRTDRRRWSLSRTDLSRHIARPASTRNVVRVAEDSHRDPAQMGAAVPAR